ncbi:MAG TPA: hypothetical protein VFU17_00710, partial [Candidatus Limnocylindrales bacterium]|nr:hypothetical protein [Candidatus Limnocylindrales bacterium]
PAATHLQARTPSGHGALGPAFSTVSPMPADWTERDERQFERAKASYLARGRPLRKAAELAARLVNKQRRQCGETGKDG